MRRGTGRWPAALLATALLAGFAVAFLTHIVVVLAFFATNGATAANIPAISDYFTITKRLAQELRLT